MNNFGKEQVVMLTINSDRNTKKVREVFSKINTSLPVLLDREAMALKDYQAYVIPSLYLIDQQQRVNRVWVGSMEGLENQLTHSISNVLELHAVPTINLNTTE